MNHAKTSQIRSAIEKAWPKLPNEFHAYQLTKQVYYITDLNVYADTILHCMRMMRLKGLINYTCLNRTESLYQKKPWGF
jgi:hypothetical protein